MRMPISVPGPPRSLYHLLSVAAVLPITAWAAVGGGPASAPTTPLAAVVAPRVVPPSPNTAPCTADHLSGCDGTDDPAPGDGRTLMYCGPDGTCTPATDPPTGEQNRSARIPAGTTAVVRHARAQP